MTKKYYFLALMLASANAFAQQDPLLKNFKTPPQAAKPRVWWHWMNGNITKAGIKKDLLWMQRSGIGGFQNFDAALETPQIVKDRLIYMTAPWKDAFKYATKLADSLKLEMAVASSPGWSETGGSWVPVEDGMKKIVWSETRLNKGQTNIRLPQAPASQGTFQNLLPADGLANNEHPLPTLYKDVAVIAFPLPSGERPLKELKPEVTSSSGVFSLERLTDGELNTADTLAGDPTAGQAWISYQFRSPQTIKAVTIMGGGDKGFLDRNGDLKEARAFEVSEDGINYRHVAYLPAGENLYLTFAVPPTTGRYFRVTFKNLPGNPGTPVAELVLHNTARVHHAEDKAAFQPAPGLLHFDTPDDGDGIDLKQIIDVSDRMKADGTLDWIPPGDNWCVLRFGYTVMATTNHPATPEATGFEVDKMDKDAIARYFNHYLGMYRDASGGQMGNKGVLKFMLTDSWEPGAQNWTPKMLDEFRHRRKYAMKEWMPTLAGYVVKDGPSTDKFLYDFRKAIADMTVEYHYDQLTDILAKEGMQRYSESHELKRALIADGMDVKRRAAVPMSAMWTKNPIINRNNQNVYISDIRESASVAHLYGQNLVAAESFSALAYPGFAWSYAPENLKATADLELANGLNRFVIHCSPHQPVDDMFPGLALGPFGQWFTRHETWAEQAKAWMGYLGRSSYLLQQGKMVSDIAYYYGEDDNIVSIFQKKQPKLPVGYDFDYVSTHALMNLFSVKGRQLVTPSGMSYKILVLDSNARKLPLAVLQRIERLHDAGARITGERPEAPSGLLDDVSSFNTIVDKIWKDRTFIPIDLPVEPDFTFKKLNPDTRLLYVHRRLAGREIYWVNNREHIARTVEVSFRTSGKVPQLWHAETGETEAVGYRIANGRTYLTLDLSPDDAVFVIFKDKAVKAEVVLPQRTETLVATLDGNWKVDFQKDRGAPSTTTLDTLEDLSTSRDPGIKYFSGTAVYHKTFQYAGKDEALWLDLGRVKNLAEVTINGKTLPVVWKKPFRVNISQAIKAGENKLEVKVVNLWVNRLIGDQQPGAKKIAYTTQPFYSADSPLQQSGLIGPVSLIAK